MALLKSYEIDECSSQELVEMLSKESLLGSGHEPCLVAPVVVSISNVCDDIMVCFCGL